MVDQAAQFRHIYDDLPHPLDLAADVVAVRREGELDCQPLKDDNFFIDLVCNMYGSSG